MAAAINKMEQAPEPAISTEHGPWRDSSLSHDEQYCERCLTMRRFALDVKCKPHIVYTAAIAAEPQAEQPGAMELSEQAVMHALDMARTDSHKQGDRALFLAFARRMWAQFEAQALAAVQPVAAGRSQHDADSAELRSLCQARDDARRERDALRAELAGMEAASGHLSALVDDLRGLLAESMRVMKALHESAAPDDGPDMDAIIPAGAFRKFVDDNAQLMHLIHVSPHELPVVADPEDAARLQAKIENNQWDHISDFMPVFDAAMAGKWNWFENTDCKYVELWIDMRDGGCLIKNRRRERISPAQFSRQWSTATAATQGSKT